MPLYYYLYNWNIYICIQFLTTCNMEENRKWKTFRFLAGWSGTRNFPTCFSEHRRTEADRTISMPRISSSAGVTGGGTMSGSSLDRGTLRNIRNRHGKPCRPRWSVGALVNWWMSGSAVRRLHRPRFRCLHARTPLGDAARRPICFGHVAGKSCQP